MKSFFAAAAIAAIASAEISEEDIRWKIEDTVEEISEAIEDIQNDPEGVKEEIAEELQREIEKALEDLECWYADRDGGDGQCAKRDRDAEMEACWSQDGMTWYWDDQECITWEEEAIRREDWCVNEEGGEWIPLREGWSPECYTGEPWQNCMMQGDEWEYNWDVNECMTRQDSCAAYGATWVDDEWGGWCQWNMLKKLPKNKARGVAKQLEKKPLTQHKLIEWSFSFDFENLEEIGQPVIDGQEEGRQLVTDMLSEWRPALEQWGLDQQQRELDALCQLADELSTSVWFGDVSFGERFGTPQECTSNWVLIKNLKKSRGKTIRDVLNMQATNDAIPEDPTGMTITFEGPTEQELNDWLNDIREEGELLAQDVMEIINAYLPDYEELSESMAAELEWVAEDAEELAYDVADDIAAVADTVNVEWWALAQKKAAAATSSKKTSKAGFYAGVSFGVLGVVAATAMVAACNKKKVQANEEALL